MYKWNIYTLYQHLLKGANWLRLQGVKSPSLRVYRVVWRPSSQRLPMTLSMLWDVPPYQLLGTSCHGGTHFGPIFGDPILGNPTIFSERHNFRDVFSEMLGFHQLFGFDSGPDLHDFLNARTWLWDSEGGRSQIFSQVPKKEPLQDSQFPPSTPSTPPPSL